MSAPPEEPWQRLDHWLWCARFLRGRADCAALVAEGSVRINRMPTGKPHARLRAGDVVTLPLHGRVRVIEVLALAPRCGPAAAARLLFREIEPDAAAQCDPCGAPRSAAYPPP